MQASQQHGFEGEGFAYLKSPVWWSGIITSTPSDYLVHLEQHTHDMQWSLVKSPTLQHTLSHRRF